MSIRLSVDWRWVLRLASSLLALAVLPVGLGILVDRRLETFPLFTLCTMSLGVNLGILVITRHVTARYAQARAGHNHSPHVGGDLC